MQTAFFVRISDTRDTHLTCKVSFNLTIRKFVGNIEQVLFTSGFIPKNIYFDRYGTMIFLIPSKITGRNVINDILNTLK